MGWSRAVGGGARGLRGSAGDEGGRGDSRGIRVGVGGWGRRGGGLRGGWEGDGIRRCGSGGNGGWCDGGRGGGGRGARIRGGGGWFGATLFSPTEDVPDRILPIRRVVCAVGSCWRVCGSVCAEG